MHTEQLLFSKNCTWKNHNPITVCKTAWPLGNGHFSESDFSVTENYYYKIKPYKISSIKLNFWMLWNKMVWGARSLELYKSPVDNPKWEEPVKTYKQKLVTGKSEHHAQGGGSQAQVIRLELSISYGLTFNTTDIWYNWPSSERT